MNADPRIPQKIAEQILITQDDEHLVLDPQMVLFEFFNKSDYRGRATWDIIKDYNDFIFSKIKVLKLKNSHLKESNEYLTEELDWMTICNAEFITILKNRQIDVHQILKDCREKVTKKANARKQMEENRIMSKAAELTKL